MIFCVVNRGDLSENSHLPHCDIAISGFSSLGEVDYESELKGESEKFESAARLSGKAGCGLLCGCRTVSRKALRKSVAAYDGGKLLGISDMNHVLDGENYKSGATLGFYVIGGYKIGLCIENDLLFPDVIKSLSMCGCTAIAVFVEEAQSPIPPLLIRAYAYLYGIPIVMCAGKAAYFADTGGEIATSTQDVALFEICPQNSYHLVTTRQKGITLEGKEDF